MIAQLEKDLGSLNDLLLLHRQIEQDLKNKLRVFETSKSKEDMNCEYMKNVFIKYLAFLANGATADARQMERLLFDLLQVTKAEREELDKARTSKGSLLAIFSKGTKGPAAGITGSFIPPPAGVPHRSQSVQKLEGRKKAGTEAGNRADISADIDTHSPVPINLQNNKFLHKK